MSNSTLPRHRKCQQNGLRFKAADHSFIVEEEAAQFVANEAACFVTLPARLKASTIRLLLLLLEGHHLFLSPKITVRIPVK